MDDETIVKMYWERDKNALAATSEKYGSYCLSIAGNILGNHEDAEECVSDTYMNTWNSIPENRPERLSTYLGRIVRNLSFNLYKKNRREKRGSGQISMILDELAELIADPCGVEETWNCKFLSEEISSFLSELDAEKRMIFVCRYWYADSVKDIAERFAMTEGNVSVTLNRLRKKLHSYLTERGFEL